MNAFVASATDGDLAAFLLGRLHVRSGSGDFARRTLPPTQRLAYGLGRFFESTDRLIRGRR